MQRRFKPEASNTDGTTSLTFKIQPSDPDFPYEIDELECVLAVPILYPASEKPSLRVGNKDIPRGFQINIERGFDVICTNAPTATLLGLMNKLDKQLERILAGQMTETIKIVANKGGAKVSTSSNGYQQRQSEPIQPPLEPSREGKATTMDRDHEEARTKRKSNVRQLEARFGRLQLFTKSADCLGYTLPLDSPKRSTWPATLQPLRSLTLTVPESYPLEPAGLHLDSDSVEARAVEANFKNRSTEQPNRTLAQQINYLSQHLKEMSIAPLDTKPEPMVSTQPLEPNKTLSTDTVSTTSIPTDELDNSHTHYIPRPPEWGAVPSSDDSEDSDSTDTDHERGDDGDAEELQTAVQTGAAAPAERGILLSFPHLELHSIELLELTSLNITVKCGRCKDSMDVERLRSSEESSTMREVNCKKCAVGMAVRFRRDLIHANSVRAGYLDLDGSTVMDMLPRYVRSI